MQTSLQNLEAEGVKTKLWCETSLQNLKVEDVKNEALVRVLPQSLTGEDVKTKLWCETSLQSFGARVPSKSET